MTEANRTQVALVRETTAGTTPTTPRMRTVRITGESLTFGHEFVDSEELRSDRMTADPILTMVASGGGINAEISYPTDETALSEIYRSTFFSAWVNTAQRDNDGTADSVITAIATVNEEVTHTTGTSFVAGQLVRFTGFGVAGNNGVFKNTTGGATSSRYIGAGLTNEAAPPAAARMKVVGFQGASADITATATGLGSTALDFTTLGLAVGQWIKVGGTADASTFAFLVTAGATARANAWMRITAIAATALTCDNLPSGWTTDAGTGKLIKVWFGDQIKNGVVPTSLTIERGFLGQTTPSYIVNTGMQVNESEHSITSRQKITASFGFTGMGGSVSTVALDASVDAATTGQIMAANANVGRLAEAGATLGSPNWAQSLVFRMGNNLRTVDDVASTSPQDVRSGEFSVSGTINTYFGNTVLLAKFYAGTATSINSRISKNNQALIYQFPRVTYRGGGNPNASGKNTDVMLSLEWTSSYDSTTSAHALLDRVEYFES